MLVDDTHNGKRNSANGTGSPHHIVPHRGPTSARPSPILGAFEVPGAPVLMADDITVVIIAIPDAVHVWHEPSQGYASHAPESEVVG